MDETKMRQYKTIYSAGFTLIELMVVVVIIAILVSVAYPSYQDSVRKARRGDAQAELIQYAAFAERIFTETNSYAGATEAASTLQDNNFYNFATVPAAASFTVSATALGDQVNDGCGNMTLTNTGARTSSGAEANCW